MASTTAMFTALSGLNANARSLDVIGNNIANVNTTAFKSNRLLFSSAISRTFNIGSAPGADTGGTNPGQIGLGVNIAGTQRDFSGGALSATGDGRDLAIEGDGFFVVNRGSSTFFTRAGAFRQNANDELVNVSGERLQGYGVDSQFNIIPGRLVDMTIPLGSMRLAQATRHAQFTGNLNAAGTLPTTGTNIDFGALSLVSGPIGGPGGNALDLTSRLVDIDNSAAPGTPLFTAGQSIQVTGAEKGGKSVPDASLAITATTTVQDLVNFLNAALGIVPGATNPNAQTTGVQLNPATGVLTVIGNTGSVNNIELQSGDLRLLDAGGTILGQPFSTTRTAEADGESVRTTFIAYDSLGTPVSVDLSMVLDSKTNAGTTWRYYAESGDDTDVATLVGSGVLSFDTIGTLLSPTSADITINRNGTGATEPLSFSLDFSSDSGRLTALADTQSSIASTFQDGSPLGTLSNYAVGIDGMITGAFTNGLTRTIGQVVMAKFANPEGLVDVGGNLFEVGPNSGTAVITTPGALGAGRIVGGSLEMSNVDLSEEFINMILASTGFSASSRVITTTEQLMQQLLVLGR